MAAVLRATSFVDGVSAEQEQDANSALTELDKGLRSGRIGVQCEAVVKFPRLFEKYPFPILINSALLKIADLYRGGNNFIRMCILRVVQQSEKHLDKILNVDEFSRRIIGVIHSNDPIARAITLRTLGSIASVIPEKKNVHHSIILGLDSHDAVEVEASIFAADRFSEKSKTFSATICSKMISMLSGLATPVEMKLKLIPSLRHMHHDADTAAKAFAVCESLLEGYPARKFVVLTLNTMTRLSIHSLVNVSSHVSRLLGILASDPRHDVHLACLHNLSLLAKHGPHLWQAENVEEVCDFLLKTSSTQLKVMAVSVLNAICGSVAVKLLPLPTLSKLVTVCRQFCYDDNISLASKTVKLLTQLTMSKRCLEDVSSEVVAAIQTFLVLTNGADVSTAHQHVRVGLKAAVELSSMDGDIATAFVETLSQLLSFSSGKEAELLCEALEAIGEKSPVTLQPAVPTILACLQKWTITGLDSEHLQVELCTLVFQAAQEELMPPDVHATVAMAVEKCGPWQMYRIARQAMRYSQYSIADFILSNLAYKVSSEHYYNWLLGLKHICVAQLRLQEIRHDGLNILPCLANAVDCYQRSVVALKAASTPAFPLEFQCEYVRLRVAWLAALRLLILTCNTFHSSPPPAIATALACSNGQEGTRWAQIVQQLEKCVRQCEDVGQQISTLYWASFDADPATLHNITLLQQSCDCVKSAISTVISTVRTGQSTQGERQFLGQTDPGSCERSVQRALHTISRELDTLLPENSTCPEKTYRLIDFLSTAAISLVQANLSFPRFFFQALQSTTVKLAISPQPSSAGESVMVRSDTSLTLKVEGVIQKGERPALFRSVNAVSVTVTTNLVSRTGSQQNTTVNKNSEKTSTQLSQTVEPHNEYFSASFVLPFPATGMHSILVEAAIVDETGATWRTGPRTTLSIKSYDDSIQRPPPARGGSRIVAAVMAAAPSSSAAQ